MNWYPIPFSFTYPYFKALKKNYTNLKIKESEQALIKWENTKQFSVSSFRLDEPIPKWYVTKLEI